MNIYNTDPLNPDTDEDGLNDGDEVILGLNPLKSDTDDNGVLDSDEYIEQDVNRNRFDNSLFSNNVAIPSALNVSAKGNANNNIVNGENKTGGRLNDHSIGVRFTEDDLIKSISITYADLSVNY